MSLQCRLFLLVLLFFALLIVDVCYCLNAGAPPSKSSSAAGELRHHQLLVFGLGRVGLQVAALAKPYFTKVIGTVRNKNSFQGQQQQQQQHELEGIVCIPINEIVQNKNIIQQSTHILIAMPFVAESEFIWETVLEKFFNISDNSMWLGMVSTTGVYGNHDGAWVTEESDLRCSPESSAYFYQEWEQKFQQACAANGRRNTNVSIFRCSGIYDSTKSALHTVWKNGYGTATTSTTTSVTEEEKEEETTKTLIGSTTTSNSTKTNRIHALDIAQAILNSIQIQEQQDPNDPSLNFRIYNLADDCPAPRSEVLEYAANLLKGTGKDLLPTRESIKGDRGSTAGSAAAATTTTRARRREIEKKLIDNSRMKNELLQELQFPSYKEGLEAILKDPTTPWNQE